MRPILIALGLGYTAYLVVSGTGTPLWIGCNVAVDTLLCLSYLKK